MPIAVTWTDLKIIILHEVYQIEKDKYDITHAWNLIFKKDINEFIYKKKQTFRYEWKRGWGMNQK